MKSIKYYALGLLSAVFVILVIACSNEEPANMQTDQSSVIVPFKSPTGDFTVGRISNGVAVPLYDEAKFKAALVKEGIFTTVESVELTYGTDPRDNTTQAFMTIIGEEPTNLAMVAVIADLRIDGGHLIIPDPETTAQAFSTHTCTGVNCRQCNFTRTGVFGRIVGCDPCGAANDPNTSSACNHTNTSGGGLWGAVKEIVKALAPLIFA